jgi:hypothetical protein
MDMDVDMDMDMGIDMGLHCKQKRREDRAMHPLRSNPYQWLDGLAANRTVPYPFWHSEASCL